MAYKKNVEINFSKAVIIKKQTPQIVNFIKTLQDINQDTLKIMVKSLKLEVPSLIEQEVRLVRISLLYSMLQYEVPIIDIAQKFLDDDSLKWCLLIIVKGSGSILKEWFYSDKVASTAITILNSGRVSFSGMDLSHICIPNANLSQAILDHTNLSGANLINTTLKGAWLSSANLKNTNLTGATFGELAYKVLSDHVTKCQYSPDGKYFSATTNSKITIYKVEKNGSLTEVTSPDESAYDFQANSTTSPSGQYSATIKSRNIEVYKIDGLGNKILINTLTSHTDLVEGVTFSHDNQWLACGSRDNTIQLWSLTDRNNVQTLTGHTGYILNIAFSHDNRWLASGSRDYTVRLWRLDNLNNSQTLTGHTNYVNSVTFSYDNQWLASGSDDNTIRLWSLTSPNFNGNQSLIGHNNWVLSVTFSHDNRWLASGGDDNTIRLWSLASPYPSVNLIFTRQDLLSVYSMAFSYDNQWLASGSRDKIVRLWNLNDHNIITFTGHAGWVISVAFSYDNKWLASGSVDNTIRLWSLTNHNEMHTLTGHTGPVRSIAYSCDKKWLASGSDDKTVKLWSLNDHSNVLTLNEHTDYVLSIDFSHDNKWLASGSIDKTVRLWSLTDHSNVLTLTKHTDYVRSVTFSHDNKWLASGSSKEIIFWNIESLSDICIYPKNFIIEINFNLRSIAYSSTCDHLILATGGGDHSVRLFEQLPENKLTLLWTSTQTTLCSLLADITYASLSATNAELLIQRGAINRERKRKRK